MNNISIRNLSKSFGEHSEIKALEQIDLEVPESALFGLIGPDGAGKTTLFRILTSLMIQDSGTAEVMGFDVIKDYKEIRKYVGYMPGKFSLYQDLSVEENLHFFATIFHTTVKENMDIIRDIYVQLEPFKKRRAGALSGGMKQKLALCCALIHEPRVLFLDEPTTGVDAVSRKEFWHMLKNLKKRGITIFVSTPYMDEASLCDEIALIQNGKIMSVNTPEGLVNSFDAALYGVRSDRMYHLYKELVEHPQIESCHSFGTYHHVQFRKGASIKAIKEELLHKGHDNLEIKIHTPVVEDVFIDLMTKEAKEL
jgi:ABC-type multidrug transport system ATPase subunit